MKQLNLIENVPDIYVNESRDFQLLLRLYQCIISGLRYNIDTVQYLTDTRIIRNSMLPLLQTKLGFYPSHQWNDEGLRLVLQAFPTILKNKGSLLAIKQLLNVYLKILGIKSSYIITYVNESTTVADRVIKDHTLSIGLEAGSINQELLSDLLKYILPTGILFDIYYFKSFEMQYTELLNNSEAVVLAAVETTTASVLRSSLAEYNSNVTHGVVYPDDSSQTVIDTENRLMGAVGTTELAGSEDEE